VTKEKVEIIDSFIFRGSICASYLWCKEELDKNKISSKSLQ